MIIKPFLEKIAERLLNKYPQSMEGIAVVLPSKRAVVFLKYYLSKIIDKPVFLPEFYSIEEFIEKISGLKVLDNISLQFRLYNSYKKYPPKNADSFNDFIKWSNVLLHDFNEIDRNLVDAESIYFNLKNVKDLENWSVEDWSLSDQKLSEMQSDYVSFYEGMLLWYKDFYLSLYNENLAYQGMAYKQAAAKINTITTEWEKVWFVGLNALTKSEYQILDVLKDKNIARVFWDADKFYFDNQMHEAGGFLRKQSKRWSEIDFEGVGDYFSAEKESFNVIACPKNISQAQVASEIVKGYDSSDLENSNTAIILSDESLLSPVLHNLPSAIKKLNVTMGSPLKNSALYSFLDIIFKMQINVSRYKKRSVHYKDVISVIEHSYFSKVVDYNNIVAFKNYIINENIVFIEHDQIISLFKHNAFVSKIFSFWHDSNQSIVALVDIIEELRFPLLGKKGTIESEVLSTLYKSLIILQNLVAENKFDIELKTMHIILQQLISKEMIPFKGEPLEGVQLMGILESRTLDFKNVVLLSVNEGILPKGKSVNSFIPYDLKRYFDLPTHSESDAVFAYHFYRLLQRARNVTLIYNSETDDFGSGEKSRFITQLISEYKGDIKEFVYKGAEVKGIADSEICIENYDLQKEINNWASNGVSPSAINKYNNCSLSFYYHYLAKIRTDDVVDEFVDSATTGTVIHRVLDKFYPVGTLTDKIIKNITPQILEDIEGEFASELSHQAVKEGKNYLNIQIAKKLTADFLELERKLIKKISAENKSVKVIGKEVELCHSISVDNTDFKLIGHVDRIDLEGDVLRIIDYKTGEVTNKDLTFTEYDEIIDNVDKSKAFQLLMYAFLYLKNNQQFADLDVIAGNYSFKNLKSGLLKVSKKIGKSNIETIRINNNVLDEIQQQIMVVLTKIKNNPFTQTTELKNCKWCDYKSICKR